MSGFFVYRPVFAWVVALFAILFGVLALVALPVEQYPDDQRQRHKQPDLSRIPFLAHIKMNGPLDRRPQSQTG